MNNSVCATLLHILCLSFHMFQDNSLAYTLVCVCAERRTAVRRQYKLFIYLKSQEEAAMTNACGVKRNMDCDKNVELCQRWLPPCAVPCINLLKVFWFGIYIFCGVMPLSSSTRSLLFFSSLYSYSRPAIHNLAK